MVMLVRVQVDVRQDESEVWLGHGVCFSVVCVCVFLFNVRGCSTFKTPVIDASTPCDPQ